ncbi:transposable element Tc1 transposase [Trichonephila clavipes]|uniref:Transposable element Tc1 transposase n=1 Tax=Trichonephila clavipes TaxID=2585209 RepID=A0A8X6T1E3_TRICX|nr:transposable element Tc1 transposase [Trichonephila clavipes]
MSIYGMEFHACFTWWIIIGPMTSYSCLIGERSGYQLQKKSPGRLPMWKNDQKAGGGAYRHRVAAEFGINKSVVSCAWKEFQTTEADGSQQVSLLSNSAIGPDFIFMDDNARPHRTLAVEELLESEDITRMDWPAYSLDLNPIEHVWDALGRCIAARLHHPENTQQLKQMLIEKWALLRKKYCTSWF